MAVRLSKVAREFNVGLSTIVDYLQEKGIKISSDPNAKLTDDQYALVAKEFSTDSEAKKESNRVDLKNTRLKKETVTIDNMNNGTEEHTREFLLPVALPVFPPSFLPLSPLFSPRLSLPVSVVYSVCSDRCDPQP